MRKLSNKKILHQPKQLRLHVLLAYRYCHAVVEVFMA